MKAVKIEIVMKLSETTENFINKVLPKLKKEHKFKQLFWNNCEYYDK